MNRPNAVPTVSIVVIFRDAVRFFREAVESALTQSYTDWELLLVDDGSDDGSEAIAREYAHQFPERIRYLTHDGRTNLGTARSRNFGIENARGRYIAELDADDVWLPRFLQRRVDILERDPGSALAFGPVLRWYSWSGDPADENKNWTARPWDALGESIQPPALLPILLEKPQLGGVPKGWLMRRDSILAVGGYPPEFRDMYEDQALICKVGLSGRARYLPNCDYLYRRHPDSMVTRLNRTRDRRQMRSGFLHWLEQYLRHSGVRHPQVERSLRRELRRCHHPRLARVMDGLADLPVRVGRKLDKISRERFGLGDPVRSLDGTRRPE